MKSRDRYVIVLTRNMESASSLKVAREIAYATLREYGGGVAIAKIVRYVNEAAPVIEETPA